MPAHFWFADPVAVPSASASPPLPDVVSVLVSAVTVSSEPVITSTKAPESVSGGENNQNDTKKVLGKPKKSFQT